MYDLEEERRGWVLRMLPRLSDLISRLASGRSELLDKIEAVAGLAGSATTPKE